MFDSVKKIFVFLIIFISSISLHATDIKSLFKELNECKQDSDKVSVLIKLSNYYEVHNTDSALLMAQKALDLSNSINYTSGIIASTQKIGIIYQSRGKYNIANTHFFNALKLAEKTNNKKYQVQIYNSIANAFAYQKLYSQALQYFEKALECAKEAGIRNKMSVLLMNMGNIAYSEEYGGKKFDKTIEYYNKALEFAVEFKDTSQMISVYGNLTQPYMDIGNYKKALELVAIAKGLAENRGEKDDLITLNYFAGRANALSKNYDQANIDFKESIKYSKEMDNMDYLSENYICLAEMNYTAGNYKEAYDYYELHKRIEDSLLNTETTKQLNELTTLYQAEKKQKELELSNQKLITKDKELKNQQIIIFSSILGLVLLLILLFVFYSRYQIKQKANTKLENAYSIIEEKQKDITDSINYAEKIQLAILPSEEDIGSSVFSDSFVLFRPRDVVSGDFYWFQELINESNTDTVDTKTIKQVGNLSLLAVADSTGHGVPGALMSMIGSSLLNQIILDGKVKTTGEILDALRVGIVSTFKQRSDENKRRDGMDISLIAYNAETKLLQYSGANNSIYYIRENELIEIKPTKQPIGFSESMDKPFETHVLEVKKGDCFYMFTDGYADQFGGEKGKKFKYAQLKDVLMSVHMQDMKLQKQSLVNVFENWKGKHEQVDDVCIAGFRI